MNKSSSLILGLVIFLIVLAGGYFYLRVFKKMPSVSKNQRLAYQTLRLDHSPSATPLEFPEELVLPEAIPVESYNLLFAETKESKDGVLVFQNSLTPAEIRDYYYGLLREPGYKFVPNSDAADTESAKTLVYSTSVGLVIIRIEALAQGSQLTITNSNILRGLELSKTVE